VALAALASALLPWADGDPRSPTEGGTCDPALASLACAGGEDWECAWGRLYDRRGNLDGLRRLLADPARADDDLLRQMFPAIGDRPIVDEPIAVPEGLVFDHRSFDPFVIPVPVDWAADPHRNNSWRQQFQALHWFYDYSQGDAAALQAGAALLVDWFEHALYAEPALDHSWKDHAIAIRLDRAGGLIERYVADSPVLNRRVLVAGAHVILTHLYALASDRCYSERHNHGLMQDLALLVWAGKYPALRDGDRLWALAQRRVYDDQVRRSVTDDGVHIENTGSYHLLYIKLINDVIRAHRVRGVAAPEELVRTRDRMLDPLVRLLQPDLTFAQFGDETNRETVERVAELLDASRELEVGDPALLAPLEWVTTGGTRGAPPATLDRVYEIGGYAAFRDRWEVGSATTAHFKSVHRSSAHYHADQTAFEIFAHRRALIVEPGAYTYVETDPFWRYQRSPAAQNVLVVDDDGDHEVTPGALAETRIVAHGGDGDVVWVQGTHANFAHLGVSSLVRSFVYAKPDTFVVIDHVRAAGEHDYAQHFHLHPDLTQLERGARSVVASVPDGPSLALAAGFAPDAIETPIGAEEGGVMKGWYFPDFLTRVPAYDVVLRSRGRDEDLAVVIVVTAAGQPARIPADVTYAEADGFARVSWTVDGIGSAIAVPIP
jgi:hypothetical protein